MKQFLLAVVCALAGAAIVLVSLRTESGRKIAQLAAPSGSKITVSPDKSPPPAPVPAPTAGGTPPAAAPAVLRAAAVRVVKKSLIRTVEQPGRIEPYETTPLFAKVAGYVQDVRKDIGDAVKAGEPLVVLRSPEMLEEVKQKEAMLRQAESAILQARAGVRVAESQVVKAEAQRAEMTAGVERAKADVDRWKEEHQRVRELTEKGAITESRLSETASRQSAAEATLKEAAAKLRAVDASVDAAKAEVEKAVADLQASESQSSVAASSREASAKMVDYLTISAPFVGYVTARGVDTGHFVSPAGAGAQPVMTIVRADRVRIVVDVPEFDAQFVGPGDPAAVRIQALGDRTLSAGLKVSRTALNLDAKSGTLRTEIDFDNSQGELRPGLYANVVIELDRREGALVLPTSALFAKDGTQWAVVVVDNKAAVREVKRGLTAAAEVEIAGGLKEGDLVVAKNGATIADGQPLEGVETPPGK